ncbi:MAG TPA: 3-isopropylmalate dehydratase small subunit [Stellaceae bacterium]|nr:3-isopropylmalate dehydratase small subunit [Stellaceae bacterium]
MEKFQRIDAPAVAMAMANIDTDQIIPARFLRKPRASGYGGFLFHDLRFAEDGAPKPEFALNRPGAAGARVLVAERNFGCGSSREHAVYALWDYGFRAVIAPSFGDIFFGNCFKNGLLPVVLPAEAAAALQAEIEQQPGGWVAVDLERQRVTAPSGRKFAFDIDAFRKECLLQGVDEIDFTLGLAGDIAAFERRQAAEQRWL